LHEVKVTTDRVIGNIGDGWEILMSMVNYERLLASASALGPMGESLRYANFHLQRRVQFGQPTFDLPTNQFKVADIIIRYHTARLLTYYAAYLFDLGQLPIMEVSIA
ncbi:MAG TPA: acyl-CoA dehydrogenase, partial [Desulfotomaculum sp.]|nr:acyl-CoA dehydrogenase [Desulfotomaculum sp.]